MSEKADVGAELVVMEDEQMRDEREVIGIWEGVVLWQNDQQS